MQIFKNFIKSYNSTFYCQFIIINYTKMSRKPNRNYGGYYSGFRQDPFHLQVSYNQRKKIQATKRNRKYNPFDLCEDLLKLQDPQGQSGHPQYQRHRQRGRRKNIWNNGYDRKGYQQQKLKDQYLQEQMEQYWNEKRSFNKKKQLPAPRQRNKLQQRQRKYPFQKQRQRGQIMQKQRQKVQQKQRQPSRERKPIPVINKEKQNNQSYERKQWAKMQEQHRQQNSYESSMWIQSGQQNQSAQMQNQSQFKEVGGNVSAVLDRAIDSIRNTQQSANSFSYQKEPNILRLLNESNAQINEQDQFDRAHQNSIAEKKVLNNSQSFTIPKNQTQKQSQIQNLPSKQQIQHKIALQSVNSMGQLWLTLADIVNIRQIVLRQIFLTKIECRFSVSQTIQGILVQNCPVQISKLCQYISLQQITIIEPGDKSHLRICKLRLPQISQKNIQNQKQDLSFVKRRKKQPESTAKQPVIALQTLKLRCSCCATWNVVPVSASDNTACLSCRSCYQKMEIRIDSLELKPAHDQ